MADKKTDFDELFGKKEPDRKPKKAAAPAQKKAPAQSRPSAAAAKNENKSGLAGGALYFLFVISVSIILACLAWAAATDVLGFKSSDTVAQITLDKDRFTYQEVEVTDDDGNIKTKKVHYADMSYVADQLKDNGIIKYKWLFKLFGSVYNADEKIDPGTYELKAIYDYKALVKKMTSGSAAMVTKKITFPEGYTMRQIFKKLNDEGVCDYDELMDAAANSTFNYSFLEGTEKGDANRLEGFLFPDTYEVYADASAKSVITKMLIRFNEIFSDEYMDRAQELNMTVDQAVTMASMIEREAKTADFDKVSAVFHNRLNSGMKLQSDAPLKYILDAGNTLDYTSDQMAVNSPYNTYNIDGLPIGPICNPSAAAIKAALYPDSDFMGEGYLYFVLKSRTQDANDPDFGKLVFSKSYEDFLKNKEAYKNS